MLKANVSLGAALLLWSLMLWSGFHFMAELRARHPAGNAAADHFIHFIVYPAGVMVILIISFLIFTFVKRSPVLLAIAAVLSFLFFPIYLLSFAAGV
jgi:hypothetical protein